MNLFGIMDVSASALKAERVRAEVVASNMANAETTRTADGGPYRRQHVVFSAADAVGAGSFGSAMQSHLGTNFSASAVGGNSFREGSAFSSNASSGVQVAGVVEDAGEPLRRYDPGHPDADGDGYVAFPDINPLTEMVDLMGATRAYGMNASAVQAEKGMLAASLDLLK